MQDRASARSGPFGPLRATSATSACGLAVRPRDPQLGQNGPHEDRQV